MRHGQCLKLPLFDQTVMIGPKIFSLMHVLILSAHVQSHCAMLAVHGKPHLDESPDEAGMHRAVCGVRA